FAVASWASLGVFFMRGTEPDDPVWLPGAILIGSAITSALLALFCRAGLVPVGAVVVAAACVMGVALRGKAASHVARESFNALRSSAGRWGSIAALVLGGVAWVYAIAPPREADAMRYHLAHIRQIIADGQWQPIADFHYGIPFAWTLNFLPFELIGLPQAAQVTALLLLLVMVGAFLRIASRYRQPRWGLLVTALFVSHPLVIRTFTAATADCYATFVLFTSGLLLLRSPRFSAGEAALLGFAGWTGVGSRYQLIVWGALVSLVFAWSLRGKSDAGVLIKRFAAGVVAAVVLASPFYIVNLLAFGNPVWPFFVSRHAGESSYVAAIARGYSDALVAGVTPAALIDKLIAIVKPGPDFPLAAVTLGVCVAGLFSRVRPVRILSAAGLLFALAWLPSWPVLYTRLVLPAIGVALLIALCFRDREAERIPHVIVVFAVAASTLMASATIYAGTDQLRYAVTGDTQRFHRYTWFYDLYDRVNRSTPKDSRFLVVVYSGHSYYLDRFYRRADPWLSAVVDWRRVTSGAALDSALSAGRYDWMIYQLRDWSPFIGGGEMTRAVADAIRTGYLIPDTVFREKLYTSRIGRRYETSDVLLLRRRNP
ncbi:MAG TPA: hypothetical protein VIF83_11660, partial [Gemmatimonadaceae bacterium]